MKPPKWFFSELIKRWSWFWKFANEWLISKALPIGWSFMINPSQIEQMTHNQPLRISVQCVQHALAAKDRRTLSLLLLQQQYLGEIPVGQRAEQTVRLSTVISSKGSSGTASASPRVAVRTMRWSAWTCSLTRSSTWPGARKRLHGTAPNLSNRSYIFSPFIPIGRTGVQ